MRGVHLIGVGVVAAAALVGLWSRTPSSAATGDVYELVITRGSIVLNDIIVNPGQKPPVSKFKNKDVEKCVRGEGDSFCADFLENDAGGRFFLYCDSKTSWRFATNPNGVGATTLEGNMDPKGSFSMAGTHALSGMRVHLVGKAKLEKGTLEPKKIKGTAYFTSPTIQEFGSAKFKSVGQVP